MTARFRDVTTNPNITVKFAIHNRNASDGVHLGPDKCLGGCRYAPIFPVELWETRGKVARHESGPSARLHKPQL